MRTTWFILGLELVEVRKDLSTSMKDWVGLLRMGWLSNVHFFLEKYLKSAEIREVIARERLNYSNWLRKPHLPSEIHLGS